MEREKRVGISPSPPFEGGEGRGEEGHPDYKQTYQTSLSCPSPRSFFAGRGRKIVTRCLNSMAVGLGGIKLLTRRPIINRMTPALSSTRRRGRNFS